MRFRSSIPLILLPLLAAAQPASPESRNGWTIHGSSSFETGSGVPQNIFDGDPKTIWHSHWSRDNVPVHPHEIAVDMGREIALGGFICLPRQARLTGGTNGRINRFEYLTSTDGTNWTQAARGRFADSDTAQTNQLAQPVTARYFKLIAWSAFSNHPWATVAELNVIPAKP